MSQVQYQYQYFSSKYQYQYKYLKMVLKYRSSTSTSTQYYNPVVSYHSVSVQETSKTRLLKCEKRQMRILAAGSTVTSTRSTRGGRPAKSTCRPACSSETTSQCLCEVHNSSTSKILDSPPIITRPFPSPLPALRPQPSLLGGLGLTT